METEKEANTDSSTSSSSSVLKTWLGTSLSEICNGKDLWNFNVNPLSPSRHHQVLFQVPIKVDETPTPRHTSEPLAWDDEHIRMPHSPKNLIGVTEGGIKSLKLKWEIIKRSLTEPINSSQELEKAIMKYNPHLPKLLALHHYIENVLPEDERAEFFNFILPGIINLALRLPEIIPGNVSLLKKFYCRSLSLSQEQVGALLANAFLCTFPWKKDIALNYPGVNFVKLFSSHGRPKRRNCVSEKIRCICHYFRRFIYRKPNGVITFERKFIPKSHMPRWDVLEKNLGNTKVHISSTGTIESDGLGCLQIDFANRNIGGGVLGYGCVQEEIRFVICPELIISRLFVEQLSDNEAVIITGAEQFSRYTGYGDDFQWAGNYNDTVPSDEFGRRRTSIAVIDAYRYGRSSQQFYPSAILREINKAYVGFSSRESKSLSPVATGNWGCGAFGGNPFLKILIQFMACSASNRNLVYFTFGNQDLMNDFYNMYLFLANNGILVCQLWSFICTFGASRLPEDKLYSFIQQSYFDKKTRVSNNFVDCEKINQPSTSKNCGVLQERREETGDENGMIEQLQESREGTEPSALLGSQSSINSDEIIPSSQSCFIEDILLKPKSYKNKLPNNNRDIVKLIDLIDGNPKRSKSDNLDCTSTSTNTSASTLSEGDKVKESESEDVKITIENGLMDVDMDEPQSPIIPIHTGIARKNAPKKITDYFTKLNTS